MKKITTLSLLVVILGLSACTADRIYYTSPYRSTSYSVYTKPYWNDAYYYGFNDVWNVGYWGMYDSYNVY